VAAYTALYRKFRPDTFKSVVGQNHIVRTLKNQISSGRVSHAYLFCGTRGTGKTSTAKIFAKTINCISPVDAEPCGECSLCKSVEEGRSVNVIEIDAASNNSVDNIREIRQEVKYPPTEGTYKVYIIDEVHMLSTGAFNALLKTLEEPPKHVIFILATTDPQKVPATIHSRCQRFDFKRIGFGEIAITLRSYVEKEEIRATKGALEYIARLADGSMRDSLSILDQCVSFFYGEEITVEKVADIVGAVDTKVFFEMTSAVSKKDAGKCMELVDEITDTGRDIKQFVEDFIGHLRNILMAITIDEVETVLDMAEDSIVSLKEQGALLSSEEVMFWIREFSALLANIKYATNERVLLEVELLKLCSPMESKSIEQVSARVTGIERQIEEGNFIQNVTTKEVSVAVEKEVSKAEKPKVVKKVAPEDIQKAINHWSDVVKGLSMIEQLVFKEAKIAYKDDGRLTVLCKEGQEGLYINKIPYIKEAYEKKFSKAFEVQVMTEVAFEEWQKSAYGKVMTEENSNEKDLEFESLMGGFFGDEM